MANPFSFYKTPSSAREHQSNANWATYERMGADEDLRGFDDAKIKAPQEVIANAHTMRWVEREYIRTAQQARAAEKMRASA